MKLDFLKRFSNKNLFEIEINVNYTIQKGFHLSLTEEINEWCKENRVSVAKVCCKARMCFDKNNVLMMGPFYVRIYNDKQRMLFKLRWC